MERNIFITSSRIPPGRWKSAFPDATIQPILTADTPPDSVVWLHNLLPAQLPGGKLLPKVHFVVMRDEPTDDDGLAALAQGAVAYCNTHATPDLLRLISTVIRNGGLWVGESLLNRMISGISLRSPMMGRQNEHPALDKLSEREREIAHAVACGAHNKEIARQFNLSERTIKAHLTSVFEKLGTRDRLELAVLLNTPS